MSSEATAPRRVPWLMLSLLMAAGVVNSLDRTSLSVALNQIRAELHLSAKAMGVLLSAFSLAYGFAQLPMGPLLDRFGARRILPLALAVWSAAQMSMRWIVTFPSFAIARVVLGFGEAPFFPASVQLVRRELPEAYKGRALGSINLSTALGQAIAPPALTLLSVWLGWRIMFAVLGALGVALAIGWLALWPSGHSSPAEASPPSAITLRSWRALFARRETWGLMLGFGGVNYVAWFFIAWLPAYLQSTPRSSAVQAGWLAAVPFLAGAAGMFASGVAADLRQARGQSLRTIHLSQIVSGMMACSAFTACASRSSRVSTAELFISCSMFFIQFAGTSGWGYVQVTSEPTAVATVGSIQNFGSFVIASLGPLATGWWLDRTHSYSGPFLLCAGMSMLGALSYLFLVR